MNPNGSGINPDETTNDHEGEERSLREYFRAAPEGAAGRMEAQPGLSLHFGARILNLAYQAVPIMDLDGENRVIVFEAGKQTVKIAMGANFPGDGQTVMDLLRRCVVTDIYAGPELSIEVEVQEEDEGV